MKLIGTIFAKPEDTEDPLLFMPADGSTAELVILNKLPEEVLTSVVEMGDNLGLAPIAVLVDFEGQLQ